MEELKQAIITPDRKVHCPHCSKVALILNDEAYVKNLKIRCRGSRRGVEHFFILNTNTGGNEE